MLRVLTLATLFPDATRPNFGVFVEKQTLGLAQRPGVELRVVAPVGLPPWPLTGLAGYRARTRLPAREAWKGLDTYRPRFTSIPATSGRFNARLLARAIRPLLSEVRHEFAFDVIDAEFFYPDGPAAVALGHEFGVPVSIKARGADIHHWGTAKATAGQILAAGQAADGMLAVSEAMRRDMAALGLPAERIRVHRTGLELDRFAPRDRSAAKASFGIDGPLVVSLGALIPRKGHDIVIDAVARLPNVSLLIAGEGAERPRLAARIAAAGVGDRVKLLGALPHAELPRFLGAADVMALASSSEGLANAWVEALGCGTPIVITEAGGARELVRGDEAGLVVPRTASAFAQAIAALLENPRDPYDVRKAAEPFTWETNAEALHAHLLGIVERRRSAGA